MKSYRYGSLWAEIAILQGAQGQYEGKSYRAGKQISNIVVDIHTRMLGFKIETLQ